MDNSVRQLVSSHQGRPGGGQRDCLTGGGGATNGGSIYIALKPLGKQ
jgi:hypothetical protein